MEGLVTTWLLLVYRTDPTMQRKHAMDSVMLAPGQQQQSIVTQDICRHDPSPPCGGCIFPAAPCPARGNCLCRCSHSTSCMLIVCHPAVCTVQVEFDGCAEEVEGAAHYRKLAAIRYVHLLYIFLFMAAD
jgi:hypothetical protein